jgi:hypothetical protein
MAGSLLPQGMAAMMTNHPKQGQSTASDENVTPTNIAGINLDYLTITASDKILDAQQKADAAIFP